MSRSKTLHRGDLKFDSNFGSAATAYGVRAWAQNNGGSTVTGSGNVSSVTDNGTGDYTFNFASAMPDTNYAAVATVYQNYNTIEASWFIRDWGTGFVRFRTGYVYTSPGSADRWTFMTVTR